MYVNTKNNVHEGKKKKKNGLKIKRLLHAARTNSHQNCKYVGELGAALKLPEKLDVALLSRASELIGA